MLNVLVSSLSLYRVLMLISNQGYDTSLAVYHWQCKQSSRTILEAECEVRNTPEGEGSYQQHPE
jgi:hypothetical protein